MDRTRELALVAVGGAVGTLVRYALDDWVGAVQDLPLSTLLVNLLGSLALGVLVGAGVPERLRLLLGTGLLGGFTTYSAFAVQVQDLGSRGDLLLGAGYALVTVAGGFALAVVGLRWGRR
ncbi:MAG: CrcB family protein [Aeromicrobium sp.]|uniref:fluoride efflux transporter FluC n=1 Tax=Aeromicrobium sp. TaxID=1871063 RepID=UPI0025B7EADB|nr:CrcB family protein [Aeromicrobium sp.]MCK5892449.1 CrcB family protein [Aeromicrobium sp.]MDF1704046.1 CrcB family protein [Aeromicrobium sp.]